MNAWPLTILNAWPLALWLAGAAAWGLEAPWWLRGALCLPAALWAPGWGWAGLARSGGLQRALDAAWIGIALAALDVAILHALGAYEAGWGGWGLLGFSGAWAVAGLVGGRAGERRGGRAGERRGGRAGERLASGAKAGAAFALACALAAGWVYRAELSRPLDIYWYPASAEDPGEHPAAPWRAGGGWGETERLGWEEAGAGRLSDPEGDGGALELAEGGWLQLALRGPVGARLAAVSSGDELGSAEVLADRIENPEWDPVPQYLERGVASLVVEAPPGALQVQIEGAGEPVEVYVLPSSEAVWSLDEAGALRYVHYYQILNLVENQRWASEVLSERWATINQPPLWSYVLACASLLVSPDLPGAAALFLWVIALVGASGVRLLVLAAPRAPAAAWLLPGLFAAVHARLMIVPGSINFPDSLYTAAMVGGLAALIQAAEPGARRAALLRFAALGLAAGLLRYPGTIALTLAAGVYALAWRRAPWRPVGALWGLVIAAAAGFGLAALASGAMREWLAILWFETVPEHYANNLEAPPIWQRPPEFYGIWLRYTGYALPLALPAATRGARLALGWALVYSLLLCTIDHFPTHYFLPLVALSGVAIGANAAGTRAAPLRHGLPALAAILAAGFLLWGRVGQ